MDENEERDIQKKCLDYKQRKIIVYERGSVVNLDFISC